MIEGTWTEGPVLELIETVTHVKRKEYKLPN